MRHERVFAQIHGIYFTSRLNGVSNSVGNPGSATRSLPEIPVDNSVSPADGTDGVSHNFVTYSGDTNSDLYATLEDHKISKYRSYSPGDRRKPHSLGRDREGERVVRSKDLTLAFLSLSNISKNSKICPLLSKFQHRVYFPKYATTRGHEAAGFREMISDTFGVISEVRYQKRSQIFLKLSGIF